MSECGCGDVHHRLRERFRSSCAVIWLTTQHVFRRGHAGGCQAKHAEIDVRLLASVVVVQVSCTATLALA